MNVSPVLWPIVVTRLVLKGQSCQRFGYWKRSKSWTARIGVDRGVMVGYSSRLVHDAVGYNGQVVDTGKRSTRTAEAIHGDTRFSPRYSWT